jgi:hypothetical protein
VASCSFVVLVGIVVFGMILGFAGYWFGWCIRFVLKQVFGALESQYDVTVARALATIICFAALFLALIVLAVVLAGANAEGACTAVVLRTTILWAMVAGFYLALFSFRLEQAIRGRLKRHHKIG